jgi:hypothetical protein
MVKYHEYIRLAFSRGYRADFEAGRIISPMGYTRPAKLYGTQRYCHVNISLSVNKVKRNVSFPLHKFIAYCAWGEAALSQGVVVRHLDGCSSNNALSNLLLGSHSENNLDKPAEIRIQAAKKARAAQPKSGFNAKFSNKEAEIIRQEYWNLKKKHETKRRIPNGLVAALRKKYGLRSRGHLYQILYCTYQGDSDEREINSNHT